MSDKLKLNTDPLFPELIRRMEFITSPKGEAELYRLLKIRGIEVNGNKVGDLKILSSPLVPENMGYLFDEEGRVTIVEFDYGENNE